MIVKDKHVCCLVNIKNIVKIIENTRNVLLKVVSYRIHMSSSKFVFTLQIAIFIDRKQVTDWFEKENVFIIVYKKEIFKYRIIFCQEFVFEIEIHIS